MNSDLQTMKNKFTTDGASINWSCPSTQILYNPALPEEETKRLHKAQLPKLKGHIWLASSGTTQIHQIKLIALSKKAILTSAKSVNEHLKSNSNDKWLNALPSFHMAGLSIYARAHLSRAKVITQLKWNPTLFCEQLHRYHITFTSLVPTQVYDLVKRKFKAPERLQAVLVGGGELNKDLYKKAVSLHWPLLPIYGMTECGGSVAIACFDQIGHKNRPPLKILPHIEVRISPYGTLEVKGPSLFSKIAFIGNNFTEINDKKTWHLTDDRGEKHNSHLVVQGRQGAVVKIEGELVNITKLNQLLNELVTKKNLEGDWLALANPDPRLGFKVDLVTTQTNFSFVEEVTHSFKQLVHGFESFQTVYIVNELPKSDLGKIKIHLLQNTLGFRYSKKP